MDRPVPRARHPAAARHPPRLYTSTDRPLAPAGIHLRDERGVESTDVKSEILGTRWRRILFQGHGNHDSINLADFTVCGLSELALRRPGALGPACAYGPTCYKPMDKLIQSREVRAAEIVMSSCNNAPFADAALYDPKYQLMLNAIDGTAKDVVAAITVHDSDRAENRARMDAALADAPSVTVLNASIRTAQPFPAYLHFGMAADEGAAPPLPSLDPEPLLLTAAARLAACLAGGLLPPATRCVPGSASPPPRSRTWSPGARRRPATGPTPCAASSTTCSPWTRPSRPSSPRTRRTNSATIPPTSATAAASTRSPRPRCAARAAAPPSATSGAPWSPPRSTPSASSARAAATSPSVCPAPRSC
ncbi:hypothetical protein [Streptomyces sp. NPDC048665]|uniref:hypothetical protein n=1 Tax=Streptomyces sp. NPDC048665 TaxID=3155490 RepID=UPI00342AF725